jgi:hypothetical protein
VFVRQGRRRWGALMVLKLLSRSGRLQQW